MSSFFKNKTRLILILFVAFGAVGMHIMQLDFNVGYAPEQPIAFSHKLHAGKLELDCKYCHQNVEKGPHATVPALSTCMGCHSVVATEQPEIKRLKEYYDKGISVPWVRIHRVPDHVYFTHQAHVHAGLDCSTCHGDIAKMERVGQVRPLEMGDCVTCHTGTDVASKAVEEGRYNTDTKYHYLRFMDKDVKEKRLKDGSYANIKGDFHKQTGLAKFQNAPISCDTCHQ